MNEFKIINFHTDNGIYADMSKRLKESCKKFNIECDIEKYSDRGSWVDNCNIKPEFILKKLNEDVDCVVWVDSDAKIMSYPYLFIDTPMDFGVRGELGARKKTPVGREEIELPKNWPLQTELMWFNSGTMLFRKCNSTIRMVERWLELSKSMTRSWDQWSLQQAWADTQPTTEWFPRTYCQIDRLHGRDKAVVLHDLASVMQRVDRK
jgi:hypothetical protein